MNITYQHVIHKISIFRVTHIHFLHRFILDPGYHQKLIRRQRVKQHVHTRCARDRCIITANFGRQMDKCCVLVTYKKLSGI